MWSLLVARGRESCAAKLKARFIDERNERSASDWCLGVWWGACFLSGHVPKNDCVLRADHRSSAQGREECPRGSARKRLEMHHHSPFLLVGLRNACSSGAHPLAHIVRAASYSRGFDSFTMQRPIKNSLMRLLAGLSLVRVVGTRRSTTLVHGYGRRRRHCTMLTHTTDTVLINIAYYSPRIGCYSFGFLKGRYWFLSIIQRAFTSLLGKNIVSHVGLGLF